MNKPNFRSVCMGTAAALATYFAVSAPAQGNVVYAHWDGAAWVTRSVAPVHWSTDTSLALDNNDVPHIGYYVVVGTANDLRYATPDGANWSNTIVDPMAANNPVGLSIATDNENRPHISYFRFLGSNQSALRYATLDGDQWQTELVDEGEHLGSFSSLKFDSSGRPHVSYDGGDDTKYATKENGVWQSEFVNGGGTSWTSLALGQDELPRILYSRRWNLRFAELNGAGSESIGETGADYSLALDSMDAAHISFTPLSANLNDEVLSYATNSSGQWESQIIAEDIAMSTSIAVDQNDVPQVAYTVHVGPGNETDVRYATLTDTGWKIEVIAQRRGAVHVSLAIDTANRPHVVFGTRVPEPNTAALWAIGIIGAFVSSRIKKRVARVGAAYGNW